jgi:amino acid adenylation domain-containing protein
MAQAMAEVEAVNVDGGGGGGVGDGGGKAGRSIDMLYLLTQAVDRAAERAAEHPALRFGGSGMTYGELADRSDRLARLLVDEGVRRGDRVGIYANKGFAAAVAMYGIMKAGAAYVPLDPSAPRGRLAFIARDCGIRHIVTEAAKRDAVEAIVAEAPAVQCVVGAAATHGGSVRALSWDDVASAPPGFSACTMELDLAYILYTSGSTGVPKGVIHTHRSALSWANIAAQTYGFTPADRISNHAPLHFDLSTLDYFAAAVAGATTVIVPESHTKLPASLSQLMETERLTVLYVVPFALVQLLLHGALEKRELRSLRWVLFGGEPMPPKHLRALMATWPHARFCNVYGPTEVNGVTYHVVPPLTAEPDEPIPIGRPYGNVEAIIVDDEDRAVAPGEAGLLLIRSPTMMRGYWGRPDLNERAFCRREVFGHYHDLFHRTGDVVQERADGTLAFLGRKDRQIKARGHRVELDEVEAALLAHDAVETAAAFPLPNADGGHDIGAAVVLKPDRPATAPDLLRHAAAQLPPYALPSRLVIMTELPRTSTDKIDRIRLQALTAAQCA